MKKKDYVEIMTWAEQGAKAQLDRIYARFPRLRPAAQRPSAAAGSAPPEAPRRRKMSRAARKRISDAQKARWAKKRR